MSQWVNNYAILQDLSVSQGRGVPVRIGGVIAGDARPPVLQLNEGVEDQFFRHYMGGPRAAPDLGLIQQMLQAVNLGSQQPRHPVSNVNTSMLNPNCAEFVPQYGGALNNNRYNENRPLIDRRERNVALKSLLEADAEKQKLQSVQLLKPDDIMQNNVTFDHQLAPSYFVSMPPAAIFKKGPAPKITVLEPTLEQNNNTYTLDVYQPSELAMEYYNKSMERTKLRTYVKDDIWAKAEEKLRETERRKQQSAQLCIEWALKEDNENLNLVRLPYHRHVIVVECVVCEMVKKHISDVNKFMPFAKGM